MKGEIAGVSEGFCFCYSCNVILRSPPLPKKRFEFYRGRREKPCSGVRILDYARNDRNDLHCHGPDMSGPSRILDSSFRWNDYEGKGSGDVLP